MASKDSTYNITEAGIGKDLTDDRPPWIFSAYGPGRNAPGQLFGGAQTEQSFEELRLHYWKANASGNPQAAHIENAIKNPGEAMRFVLNAASQHPNRLDTCKNNSLPATTGVFAEGRNKTTQNNPFGAPSKPSPFGQPSSAFGQPSQPAAAAATSSPFGAAAAASPFGAAASKPGGFGQPSFGQPAFGQPAFGQSGFGKPAAATTTTAANTTPSAFGQPSQLGGAGGFGQPSALGQRPSAFGTPSAGGGFAKFAQGGTSGNAFGQPSQLGSGGATSGNAFGQPSQLGGATGGNAFGKPSTLGGGGGMSAFGQPSGGAAGGNAFGKPSMMGQTASPFGAAAGANASPFGAMANNNTTTTGGGFAAFAKPAATTTTTTQSPFATAGQAGGQTTGIFGKPAQTAANPFTQNAAAASPFGQPSTTTTTTTTQSPFGKPATATTTQSPFGQPTTTATTQSPFGQPTTTTTTTQSPFGKPATTTAAAPNPFQQAAQQQPAQASNPFTQAAPANNVFGRKPEAAATAPGASNIPIGGSGNTRPAIDTYATRDGDGRLLTFKGRPVTYQEHEGKAVPFVVQTDGKKIKVWFPNGAPPYNKDTVLDGDKDKAYPSDVQAQYDVFLKTGRFDGGVMPMLPPKPEWCRWDF